MHASEFSSFDNTISAQSGASGGRISQCAQLDTQTRKHVYLGEIKQCSTDSRECLHFLNSMYAK